MKILSPKEISDKKQAELAKDIKRTKEVTEVLERKTKELAEIEAKFNVALSNQRVRWSMEEGEYLKKIEVLQKEIKEKEIQKDTLLSPIVEREKKSYDLLKEAEKAFNEAQDKYHESEKLKEENEINADLLEEKLDQVHERENDLENREQKVSIREKASEEERAMIKNLSAELSIKLQNLK